MFPEHKKRGKPSKLILFCNPNIKTKWDSLNKKLHLRDIKILKYYQIKHRSALKGSIYHVYEEFTPTMPRFFKIRKFTKFLKKEKIHM